MECSGGERAIAALHVQSDGAEPWDEHDDDDNGDGFLDPFDECGRTDDGTCMLAGSEWCDFECPFRDTLRFSAQSDGAYSDLPGSGRAP